MFKCATKFTFPWVGFTILLLTVCQCTSLPRAGSSIGELSHFEGKKADSDLICESQLVGRKTPLPTQISFTSQLPITAYSVEATKYHRHGFTISIQTGALNTNAIGLVVIGPKTLPYAVLVKFYCDSTPMDNGKIPALSHSRGTKLQTDSVCRMGYGNLNKPLPATIDFAPLQSNVVIVAYTAVASEDNMQGFTIALKSGALGTGSIVFTLDVPGAQALPYAVNINLYCRFV